MLTGLLANIGTIVIALVLAGIVTAAILLLRRDKSACGGGCGSCPFGASCRHGK